MRLAIVTLLAVASVAPAAEPLFTPDPLSVQRYGPAYRYPQAGWIVLHIEGAPYERGYQHGYLMAREIPEYLERCAADMGTNAAGWDNLRTQANALFLRGFDREILEEMRGIADGANAAGAKWLGRRIDLIDIALANTTVEMGELASAMPMTPTGIEGTQFASPPYAKKQDSPTDHCSAFAATGPAPFVMIFMRFKAPTFTEPTFDRSIFFGHPNDGARAAGGASVRVTSTPAERIASRSGSASTTGPRPSRTRRADFALIRSTIVLRAASRCSTGCGKPPAAVSSAQNLPTGSAPAPW